MDKRTQDLVIGFIGQGWIGKNYADDFERRGFTTIRYALEEPFIKNRDAIADCDIVFIAVPTPTTPLGFDASIVREALKLVGLGKTAVIKSTILPGTTEQMQHLNPGIYVMHSPEFLVEKTAAYDAANPKRNIVGVPQDTAEFRARAQMVLSALPPAPYARMLDARSAELIKYAGNCFLYTKLMFANILYDLARAHGADWHLVREAFVADPRIGESHTHPVHDNGRGAGGHCFIKDFEAFLSMYEGLIGDTPGLQTLMALRDQNLALLADSRKDADLVAGVYHPHRHLSLVAQSA